MTDDKSKKGIAALIVGKLAPKGPSDGSDDGQDQHDQMKSQAAEDMLAAIKSGDHMSFKNALEDFIKMCDTDDYSEPQ